MSLPFCALPMCFLGSNAILCQLSQRKTGNCSKSLRKTPFLLSPLLNARIEGTSHLWTSRNKSLHLAVHQWLSRTSGGNQETSWPESPLFCRQSIHFRMFLNFQQEDKSKGWKQKTISPTITLQITGTQIKCNCLLTISYLITCSGQCTKRLIADIIYPTEPSESFLTYTSLN